MNLVGRRTYAVCVVIIALAACQKFLGIAVPNEVWIALFGLVAITMRAAVSNASALLMLLLIPCMLLTGCMSDKQWSDTKEMHANYMRQPRTYQAVELSGTNMTIHLTGVTRLALEAPLNPLTVIPQNPEIAKDVVDGIVRVGTVAGATYVGSELATRAGNTTINNNAAKAATP